MNVIPFADLLQVVISARTPTLPGMATFFGGVGMAPGTFAAETSATGTVLP